MQRRSSGVRPGAPSKRGTRPSSASQPCIGRCVHAGPGGAEDLALALAITDLLFEKGRVDFGDHNRRFGRAQAALDMIPEILGDIDNELTALAREAIGELHDLFIDLDRLTVRRSLASGGGGRLPPENRNRPCRPRRVHPEGFRVLSG